MRRARAKRWPKPFGWLMALLLAGCSDRLTLPAPADQVDLGSPQPERWAALTDEIRARFPDVPRISIEELRAELQSDAPPLLLDVRAEDEYSESHLGGARRASDLEEALEVLGAGSPDRSIVVYCSVGYRSAMLADELELEGFTNVRNLEGSIFAWANAGYPVFNDFGPASAVHPYDEDWGTLLRRDLWPDAERP